MFNCFVVCWFKNCWQLLFAFRSIDDLDSWYWYLIQGSNLMMATASSGTGKRKIILLKDEEQYFKSLGTISQILLQSCNSVEFGKLNTIGKYAVHNERFILKKDNLNYFKHPRIPMKLVGENLKILLLFYWAHIMLIRKCFFFIILVAVSFVKYVHYENIFKTLRQDLWFNHTYYSYLNDCSTKGTNTWLCVS